MCYVTLAVQSIYGFMDRVMREVRNRVDIDVNVWDDVRRCK